MKFALPTITTSVALLAGCGGGGGGGAGDYTLAFPPLSPSPSPPSASLVGDCSGLQSKLSLQGLSVTKAVPTPATAASGGSPTQPDHCDITGSLDQRVGVDGLSYAIKFHLRIPTAANWNGKFIFTGGGGSNGTVGNALTASGVTGTPLAQGYAVVATDSGHDNEIDNLPAKNGTRTFLFDQQARIDFAYNSYGRVTDVSKAIINAYSGRAPDKSYFVGCSEGGREAVLMTQRFAENFDGVLAGAPAFNMPLTVTVAPAWMAQSFAPVALAQGNIDRNGYPFLNKSFTDADLDLVASDVANKCDALDGVTDGMVMNTAACQAIYDPSSLVCAPGQTSGCLSAIQVSAMKKNMAGARNSAGDPLYPSWLWDTGFKAQMRSAWIGPISPAPAQTTGTYTGSPIGASVLTPPQIVDTVSRNGSDQYKFLLDFDFDVDVFKAYATTAMYSESLMSLMNISSPDLSKFRDRGGKMIVYLGTSDSTISPVGTIDWWNSVNKNEGGTATNYSRLFTVPAMGHCAGGPATTNFDFFTSLVNWVEKGVAPESVVATAPAGTPWPGRARPLCVYPKYAKYTGSGSIESADSFTCVAP